MSTLVEVYPINLPRKTHGFFNHQAAFFVATPGRSLTLLDVMSRWSTMRLGQRSMAIL